MAAVQKSLTIQGVLWLTFAAAIITANAYYVHPIVALIARDFNVSEAWVGFVPAANQFALAAGIFLLLPLGDRLSNRWLSVVFVTAQTFALLIMALAQSFWLFVFGSALLGFFTVSPYLLPAFASRRVAASRLGLVTSILTTGVVAGVILSRVGAGLVAEWSNWRDIYWIALSLMAGSIVMLVFITDDEVPSSPGTRSLTYRELLFSMFGLAQKHKRVILSGCIQAISFGGFLAVWMGIGLHLPNALGIGVDKVGFLALFSSVNLVFTPFFGRLADRIGPLATRCLAASIQLFGIGFFFFAGGSFWLLFIPILISSVSGPSIDVTGRMTVLSKAPEIRTRLMTVYIVLMFIGGGIGSWAGTSAYSFAGWWGTCALAFTMSSLVLTLSVFAWYLGNGESIEQSDDLVAN